VQLSLIDLGGPGPAPAPPEAAAPAARAEPAPAPAPPQAGPAPVAPPALPVATPPPVVPRRDPVAGGPSRAAEPAPPPRPVPPRRPAPAPAVPPRAAAPEPRTYTVTDLVRACGRLLEGQYGDVWVEGEISNLAQPVSGHVYFTLKDAGAQVGCACFRREARLVKFRLENGLKVRCHGRVTLYDAQGKFQLYVDRIEPSGVGAAALALEQLKRRLQAEGLFDAARKRPLPFWPRVVGVVTSPTGAAVRDLIRVTHRRAATRLVIAPAQVQGETAPQQLVAALARVARVPGVEVVVLARGGGSSEDLSAFNDEGLARAIAACPVPVISAVGHEVDVTVADLVADLRAATPSHAGEQLVPMQAELATRLARLDERLGRAARHRITDERTRAEHAWGRLTAAAAQAVTARRLRLQELDRRLAAAHPAARLGRDRAALTALERRLAAAGPAARIARGHVARADLAARLRAAMLKSVERRRGALGRLAGALGALSPLQVLERGYSVTRDAAGAVLTDAAAVAPGAEVSVRLARGELGCRVAEVRPGEPRSGGDER
jgi:exodeoxyribonuclease VII large subunit